MIELKKMIIDPDNFNSILQLTRNKLLTSFSNFKRRYLFTLVLAMTIVGINYYYSVSMMILTTFILAYLTKGSRRP